MAKIEFESAKLITWRVIEQIWFRYEKPFAVRRAARAGGRKIVRLVARIAGPPSGTSGGNIYANLVR